MAAGQGFKTFTTGEVLTAGDVNGYLMQGINVFTNATARDAAITAPAEGQFAFTKDNNSLWYYDGAAWVASGAAGDIEGVTAGVGISGGGTSGTVTVTNSMATAIDAKGDLVPGTGADTFARLAVGANNTVLTADSSTATGLKWATPAAGGMTLLESGSLTGSSVTTGSLSQSYVNLYIVLRDWYPSQDDERVRLRVNGVSAANSYTQGNQTTVVGAINFDSDYIGLSIGADNTVHSNLTTIDIADYTNTSTFKVIYSNSVTVNATTTTSANMYFRVFAITKATSAISTLTFYPSAANFSGGTYYVYGVK